MPSTRLSRRHGRRRSRSWRRAARCSARVHVSARALKPVLRYGHWVTDTWMPDGDGVLALPSGRLVRGRGLRGPDPEGPDPEFGLYVVASEPFGVPWDFRWVAWPDYGLPSDPAAMRQSLVEAGGRADRERVEVAGLGPAKLLVYRPGSYGAWMKGIAQEAMRGPS